MKHAFNDPFHAIADVHRRNILQLLSKDDLSINNLAGHFDMSRPAVSRHIRILYQAGFITIEDKGRERVCALKKEGFHELQDWLNYFDQLWNTKLDALGSFLSKTTPKKRKPSKIKL